MLDEKLMGEASGQVLADKIKLHTAEIASLNSSLSTAHSSITTIQEALDNLPSGGYTTLNEFFQNQAEQVILTDYDNEAEQIFKYNTEGMSANTDMSTTIGFNGIMMKTYVPDDEVNTNTAIRPGYINAQWGSYDCEFSAGETGLSWTTTIDDVSMGLSFNPFNGFVLTYSKRVNGKTTYKSMTIDLSNNNGWMLSMSEDLVAEFKKVLGIGGGDTIDDYTSEVDAIFAA